MIKGHCVIEASPLRFLLAFSVCSVSTSFGPRGDISVRLELEPTTRPLRAGDLGSRSILRRFSLIERVRCDLTGWFLVRNCCAVRRLKDYGFAHDNQRQGGTRRRQQDICVRSFAGFDSCAAPYS